MENKKIDKEITPFLPFVRQDCFLFDNNREIKKRKVIHSRVEKEKWLPNALKTDGHFHFGVL
jgi:hypothetical protein